MAAKSTAVAKKAAGAVALPGVFGDMMAVAQVLAESRIVPVSYAGRPEAIFAAIQYGREFGIPPMSALQNIAVINGKPTLGTDLALGLAHKHKDWRGYRIEVSTDTKAKVVVSRMMPTGKIAEFTGEFTIEDARKAGLVKADGAWQKWPKRMLKHRATAFAIRDAFADAMYGQYTFEELASEEFGSEEERILQEVDKIDAATIEEKAVPVEVCEVSEAKPKAKAKAAPKVAPRRK